MSCKLTPTLALDKLWTLVNPQKMPSSFPIPVPVFWQHFRYHEIVADIAASSRVVSNLIMNIASQQTCWRHCPLPFILRRAYNHALVQLFLQIERLISEGFAEAQQDTVNDAGSREKLRDDPEHLGEAIETHERVVSRHVKIYHTNLSRAHNMLKVRLARLV